MKASEFIALIQSFIDKYGDLEIARDMDGDRNPGHITIEPKNRTEDFIVY